MVNYCMEKLSRSLMLRYMALTVTGMSLILCMLFYFAKTNVRNYFTSPQQKYLLLNIKSERCTANQTCK